MTTALTELAYKRVQWQCRRGLLELDMLFEQFLANGFSSLSSAQQAQFSDLLQLPDPVLAAWLLGTVEPAEPWRALVEVIVRSSK